ncbi:MAG: hypothetical protein ACXWNH_17680 [Vulcanimicrobiaceae bacterium]
MVNILPLNHRDVIVLATELSDQRLPWTLATAELRFGNQEGRVSGLVRTAAIAPHESSGFAAGKPDDLRLPCG